MKTQLKSFLPRPIHRFLRERRRQQFQKQYFEQSLTRVQCGDYEIEAPDNHLILTLPESQPYRDLCVGIVAKYVSAKYPNGTIIDVGANIGDTAAIIATYASNKLILIDASDYFHDILVRNVTQLPNEVVIEKVMLADGTSVSGALEYKRGTATFQEKLEGGTQIKTARLADIADENTCFVKVDTDGYDRKILLASLDWLDKVHPAVLYESYIHNPEHLENADELYSQLSKLGYEYFIVWDDPGFHLLSTTSLDVLIDLNRYLFKVFQNDGRKSIYNYDILCLHRDDRDIYDEIRKWCRTY